MHLGSPLFIILFFKISFTKSIRLPTSLFKEYYMHIDIALAEALLLILSKADAKLLKQQLFKVFDNNLESGRHFET